MAFAKCHFVITADSRGHGRSSDTNAPLSYAAMSEDILRLLDHLRVQKSASSAGATLALSAWIVLRRPERVEKLVAIGANFDVDGLMEKPVVDEDSPPMPLRYRLFAYDPTHWSALYRKVVTMWRTQPNYSKMDLSKIEAQTLIMAGDFDIIKRDHTHQLADTVPHVPGDYCGGRLP
jgi:pimeloyl-ACP methyl ester carboxylesterase